MDNNKKSGTRRIAVVAVAVLVLAGLAALVGKSSMRAANLAPALSLTAIVCHVTQYSSQDPGPSGIHKHKSVDDWELERGKEIDIRERWYNYDHYFDVDKSWPNELQNPDVYPTNEESNPVRGPAAYPNGCTDKPPPYPPIYAKRKFVFAFAIDDIKNDNAPKSPHTLIFVPIYTGQIASEKVANEFVLLLFHMESDKKACSSITDPLKKEQCEALADLRRYWSNEPWTEDSLKDKMNELIKKILMVRSSTPAEIAASGDPEITATIPVEILNHNGVIHGIF